MRGTQGADALNGAVGAKRVHGGAMGFDAAKNE